MAQRYAVVELRGKDPDDWPELTPENAAKFERELTDARPDDLLDGLDLDGVRFFVHARDVERISCWN